MCVVCLSCEFLLTDVVVVFTDAVSRVGRYCTSFLFYNRTIITNYPNFSAAETPGESQIKYQ